MKALGKVILLTLICITPIVGKAGPEVRFIVVDTFVFQMDKSKAVDFLSRINPSGQPDYGLQEIEKLVSAGIAKKLVQIKTRSPDSRLAKQSEGAILVQTETLMSRDTKWGHINELTIIGKTRVASSLATQLPGIVFLGEAPIATDKDQLVLVFAECYVER